MSSRYVRTTTVKATNFQALCHLLGTIRMPMPEFFFSEYYAICLDEFEILTSLPLLHFQTSINITTCQPTHNDKHLQNGTADQRDVLVHPLEIVAQWVCACECDHGSR